MDEREGFMEVYMGKMSEHNFKNVGQNGMLRHSLGGEVIFFFAAYYGVLLKFNDLFVYLSCFLLPACPPEVGGRQ